MLSTLVLNADYTPLSVLPISAISWKDAIKIIYLGNAKAVEFYKDWQVHSPSMTIDVPSVIISTTYIKKKHGVKFSRTNLLIRDNFTCQYCQKQLSTLDLTVDHVVPRVKGGKTKWENIVCACYTCNTIKGHRTKMKPIKMPQKPDYWQLIDNAMRMPISIPDASWQTYLNWPAELVTIKSPSRN